SNAHRLLDVAKRPAQPAERKYLLLLVVAQDVHLGAGPRSRRVRQRPGDLLLRLAGFQVSLTGRFWVSPEAESDVLTSGSPGWSGERYGDPNGKVRVQDRAAPDSSRRLG